MASSSLTSRLSEFYRLERLVVRTDGEETPAAGQAATYIHENPGDEAHLYEATTKALENENVSGCEGTNEIAVQFSLHIANRFGVTLCLSPQQPEDSMTKYNVKSVGPMMSTRMMPMDEAVQKLEYQWGKTLPAVTTASFDDDGNLSLTSPGERIQILFIATDKADAEEGAE